MRFSHLDKLYHEMSDFLSKLENFLFDILGLILPGAIFLLILISPLLWVDLSAIPKETIGASFMLSVLSSIYNTLSAYWSAYPKSALAIAIILAYLAGHVVKVFSIIKYDFLTAIFDRSINKLANRILNWGQNLLPARFRRTIFFNQLKEIYKPFKTLIGKIFIFRAPQHQDGDDIFLQNCKDKLDKQVSMSIPKEAVNKISGIISNQEGVRNLGTFFLAKYNLYRSLSLIFLFSTFYYIAFFSLCSPYVTLSSRQISTFIFVAPVLLWFTFHVKYKRYWTLYGHERVMSLFYILNKKKINEG